MATLTEALRVGWGLDIHRGYLATLQDDIETGDELTPYYGMVFTEMLRIGAVLRPNQLLNLTVTDAVSLVDQIRLIFPADVVEALNVTDAITPQFAIALVEQLQLSGQIQSGGRYNLALTERMRLRDSLGRFFGADVIEELALDDALTVRAKLVEGLSDTIEIEVETAPRFVISAKLTDGLDIDVTDAVAMLFSPTLTEGIEISTGYLAPDGSFSTWAMNVHTGAVTEYDNYAFNSFAQIGNRYLGASETGLYELNGDDDDGDDIIARLRSGFMQFGGTHLSRLKAAYIAARGEGDVILRIITGDGVTYDYQASTRNMRSTKVDMGKGQRARYFAFELITAGQDFDLDTLEFVPIVVQRRV